MSIPPASRDANDAADRFHTTHWSLVAAAQDRASPEAQRALTELCEVYWYPLYAFIRRSGHGSEEARDLTQEFFARLLEKDYLAGVDREKGKFRSFLLTACKHFLANERDRAAALKRGGGCTIHSFNSGDAENRLGQEPSHLMTPDRLYDRHWALMLLQNALTQLRREFQQAGKEAAFERLKGLLTGEKREERYAEVAAALGISESSVKVSVYRLRRRYGEILREEISRTLRDPSEIDAEIRDLFVALRAM
ncbi:MAG TPA: sigma-70 family RNA polymerase sigma factor [Gemmataceae bacterium]|nr:sigma-70 family RNA polymerase sigma factor [Gemmataceae bacterium]